jgi:hypothetical protein
MDTVTGIPNMNPMIVTGQTTPMFTLEIGRIEEHSGGMRPLAQT